MIWSAALGLMLACNPATEMVGGVEAEPPDGPARPTDDVDPASKAGQTAVASELVASYPVAGGPTEIWSNGKIVGVAYRSGAEEHIYMFTEGLAAGTGGWDPSPPSIGLYSTLLSPYYPLDSDDSSVSQTYKPLLKCDSTKKCSPCDGSGSCFADHAAFAADTGVWKVLQERMGTTSSKAVKDLTRKHAAGSIGTVQAFTESACKAAVGGFAETDSHVDRARKNGVYEGWEFVGEVSSQSQTAYAVLVDPATDINAHEHHNDKLPDDGNADNKRGDEWCANVKSECSGKTCNAIVVSLTHQ